MHAAVLCLLFIGLVVGSGKGISTFISDPFYDPPTEVILVDKGGFKFIMKSSDGAPFLTDLAVCRFVNGSQDCKNFTLKGSDGSATIEYPTEEDGQIYKLTFKTSVVKIFMTCFTNPISDFDHCLKAFPQSSAPQKQLPKAKTPEFISNVSYGTNIISGAGASTGLSYTLFPDSDFEFCLVPWVPVQSNLKRRFCITHLFKDLENCTDYTQDSFPSAHGALTKPRYAGSDWLYWNLEIDVDPTSPPWFIAIIGVKNALKGFCP